MKLLLDKTEAADTLSISVSCLMNLVNDGKLKKRMIGTRVLFAHEDLSDFVAKLDAGEIKKAKPGRKRLAG